LSFAAGFASDSVEPRAFSNASRKRTNCSCLG
jgi:hypothetical protein